MLNKSTGFLAALTVVTTMASGFSLATAATETKTTESLDVTESISAEISEEIEAVDVEDFKIPMLAVAIASEEDSEMIAQVIIVNSDDDTKESDISAIKPGESYTFEISDLNIMGDNIGGLCLTFDFGEHQNFFEENVEKINIDVNSIKIDGVEFNINPEHKSFDESDYNNGFSLFSFISEDSESYNKVFFTDSETSEIGKTAESISIEITVNELVLKENDVPEETTITTTAETTTTTESTTETTETTTEITETTKATTNTVVNTTKATTKATTATTTKSTTVTTTANNSVTPPTGDSGVGVAVAVLAASASLAFVIKKREK